MKSMNDGIKKNVKRYLPLALLVACLFVLGMCSQSKKEQLEKEKKAAGKEVIHPINVVTLEMKPREVKDQLSLPGTLAPWLTLVVSSETSGMILEKRINVGDTVRKGQILATIDGSKYKNAYNSAKATYDNALTSKKRLEALYRSEITNKTELDAVTAQMENAMAVMKIAAIDLEKTVIKAPDSGIVNRVDVEKGQFTDVGKPVVTIIRIHPVKVNVGIPESDIHAVKDIEWFDVTVDALNGKTFKARRHALSRTTGSLARLYDMELSMDNPSGELLPDMFVRVNIVKKKLPGAFAVPLYAILSMDDKKFVFVAENSNKEAADAPRDTAVRREISTGVQDGWMVEVTKGLKAGDAVITVGQRSVSDGQKITIIRTQDEQENLLR